MKIDAVLDELTHTGLAYGAIGSVLHLGCSDGLVGAAVRSLADHGQGRYGVENWQVRIAGVEPDEELRTPMWQLYDGVKVEAVDSFLKSSNARADAVLLLSGAEEGVLSRAYALADKCLITLPGNETMVEKLFRRFRVLEEIIVVYNQYLPVGVGGGNAWNR